MIDYYDNVARYDINFEKLDESGLTYFRDAYTELFRDVLQNLEARKTNLLGKDPSLAPITPEDQLTGREKAAMIAKKVGKVSAQVVTKVVVNTLISEFTGIDPVFLDSHLNLAGRQSPQMRYYLNCNPNKLLYTVDCDLTEGTEN